LLSVLLLVNYGIAINKNARLSGFFVAAKNHLTSAYDFGIIALLIQE
jgi:hypothetical protein